MQNRHLGKGYIDEFSSSSCNINIEIISNSISVSQINADMVK